MIPCQQCVNSFRSGASLLPTAIVVPDAVGMAGSTRTAPCAETPSSISASTKRSITSIVGVADGTRCGQFSRNCSQTRTSGNCWRNSTSKYAHNRQKPAKNGECCGFRRALPIYYRLIGTTSPIGGFPLTNWQKLGTYKGSASCPLIPSTSGAYLSLC